MKDSVLNVNQRIAARLRELRATQRFSLEELANKSGVSRSMISVIERGESSPTAAVLDKLAAALNIPLASFFNAPKAEALSISPVARREDQIEWRDPASGYIRRTVSPPQVRQPMQVSEVFFPPGARVSFENAARDIILYQQIWMLEGTMDVTVGKERHRLRRGDCLATQVDVPMVFHNPTKKCSRYAVVNASGESFRR